MRAYLPPLVRKGDAFDVEVRLPEGSKATSLNGGWLMETYLSEQAVVPGRGVLEGHVFAKAKGPIMIAPGTAEDDATRVGLLKRGRVLGGGVSMTERDLAMYLRNDFRMGRNSERIAERIGDRFHHYNR
ncbi:MAG: flagellar basal body P-ring protein FlgI, partial [Planctomycetaceae bacterium]